MELGERNLIELVNQWAAYSAVHPNADVAGFCLHYLTQHTHTTVTNQQRAVADDGSYNEKWVESLTGQVNGSLVEIRPEARLGALVGRLAKFAYFYSKKAMQPLDFNSIDDPVYLIALVQMGTPKKSELIYEMMAEFASGIDVINRLVGLGLIDEFPDEHDRRSKRLRITPKGIGAIQNCFPVMDKVANIAYGSLTDGEKAMLVQILDKLDRYHAEHYKQSRNAEFDEVYERMVAGKNP